MSLSTYNFNLNANFTPQNLTGTNAFTTATFYGFSGYNLSTNTPLFNSGTVWLGYASGKSVISIATGQSYTVNLFSSAGVSLSNYWINGGLGDGVFVVTQ